MVGGKRVELELTVVDDEVAGFRSSSSSSSSSGGSSSISGGCGGTSGEANAHGIDLLQSGADVLQMKCPTGKPCV